MSDDFDVQARIEGLERRVTTQGELIKFKQLHIDKLRAQITTLEERVSVLEQAPPTSIEVDQHHAEECDCQTCLIQYDASSDFNAHDYYNK